MGKTIRFGVSLDEDLLEPFDKLCAQRGYSNRSEAIRDLLRKTLIEDSWQRTQGVGAGTLTLVYDHHKNDLARKLTTLQHEFHQDIITTLHIHLDHYHCLEVLVLKGEIQEIRTLADRLIATRGVKHGSFTLTTTGEGLA